MKALDKIIEIFKIKKIWSVQIFLYFDSENEAKDIG